MSIIPPAGGNSFALFYSKTNTAQQQPQPEEKSLVDKIQKVGGFRKFAEIQQEKALFVKALGSAVDSLDLDGVLEGIDVEELSIDQIKEKLRAKLEPETYIKLIEKIEEFIEREIKEKIYEESGGHHNGTFSTLV